MNNQHQRDMFYSAQRSMSDKDQTFFDMMHTHPITPAEFAFLRKNRPEVWARYDAYFGATSASDHP